MTPAIMAGKLQVARESIAAHLARIGAGLGVDGAFEHSRYPDPAVRGLRDTEAIEVVLARIADAVAPPVEEPVAEEPKHGKNR